VEHARVKALGCVVVVAAVAVGGFFALTAWLITRGDDQSALTERVELTVIDPHEDRDPTQGGGYTFDYAYEKGGQWYGGGEEFIRDNYWSPGQTLTACIDPDEPAQHVITLRFERCGQETIVVGSIKRAEPRGAPSP
jgi:hypothetical protein